MAKYIASLFYNIGASTKDYDAAMLRVEKAEQKLQELQSKNNAAAQKSAIDLNSLKEKFADLEAQRAKMFKDGARSGQKEYDKLLVQLEKLDTKIQTLTAKSKVDASARASAEERVQREIKKTQERYDEMRSKSDRAMSSLASFGKMFAGGGAFAIGVKSLQKMTDELDKLGKNARDVGLTASALFELRTQADKAGISASALDGNLKKFQENVGKASRGVKEYRDAFSALGVQLTDANGNIRTTRDLLPEVADKMREIGYGAEASDIAVKLFSETGREMVRIFQQGGDEIKKAFGEEDINAAAAAAENLNNKFSEIFSNIKKNAYVVYGQAAEAFGFGEEQSTKTARTISAYRRGEVSYKELEKVLKSEKAISTIRSARIADLDREIAKIRDIGRNTMNDEAKARVRLEEIREELAGANSEILWMNELESRNEEQTERLLQAYKDRNALETEAFEIKKKLQKIDSDRERASQAELKLLEKQSNASMDRLKARTSVREDFELQTKISILEAQGKTREAEAIKFAQARNQLMEKYGYSLEQATRVQKTLNDLQNAKEGKGDAKYSDEAVKRAQKVLERGEGGSVGKKTLEDARAIVEGRTPEGGFQTAMFEKYAPQENKSKKSLKNINIDAKATRDNLDKKGKEAENKDTQALIALEKQMTDLNKVVDDIKNFVGKIATKKESAA